MYEFKCGGGDETVKLIFDRTAYLNETSVLTNFEKKHEIPGDSTVRDLVKRFTSQHLKMKGDPLIDPVWRIYAIMDMKMRDVAIIENDEPIYMNRPGETLAEFLGKEEPVTILAVFQRPEDAMLLKNACKDWEENRSWQKVPLPIRVDTRGREILAYILGIMSIGSLVLLFVQYNYNKAILTEAVLGVIIFALGFYFLLLQSRYIVFSTRSIMYRNRYSKYEKFNVEQFEYLDWSNHGSKLKFVFKFDEKGRNFISAVTDSYVDLVIWAVSNRIPIYSSDFQGKPA